MEHTGSPYKLPPPSRRPRPAEALFSLLLFFFSPGHGVSLLFFVANPMCRPTSDHAVRYFRRPRNCWQFISLHIPSLSLFPPPTVSALADHGLSWYFLVDPGERRQLLGKTCSRPDVSAQIILRLHKIATGLLACPPHMQRAGERLGSSVPLYVSSHQHHARPHRAASHRWLSCSFVTSLFYFLCYGFSLERRRHM